MSIVEKVSVVIINWNSGPWLKRCLEGVAKQSRPPDKILLVDNGSKDGSLDGVGALVSNLEIIHSETNLGFAAGNNLALQNIHDCEWVALLNPDAIPEKDWLESLLTFAYANPRFHFFATKMLNQSCPDIIDGAGDIYHLSGLGWPRGEGHKDDALYSAAQECFSVCGGSGMYRFDIMKAVGGFDESFFCYCEDTDLAFRLRLAGYRCCYVPEAVVHHVGSASTGKKSDFSVYYGHRNLVWTYFKNMPLTFLICFLPLHFFLNFVTICYFSFRGQARVILRAKIDALAGLPAILKKRRDVQRLRKVSLFELWRVFDKSIVKH